MPDPTSEFVSTESAPEGADHHRRTGRHLTLYRLVLISCGLLCLALGVLGIFVPLLPTTIFLILAAACFIRSSERMHRWLIHHRILGTYLRLAQGQSGIPLRAKIVTLMVLWATILVSAFWFNTIWWVRVVLLAIAVSVSIFILTRPTLNRTRDADAEPDADPCGDDATCPQIQ